MRDQKEYRKEWVKNNHEKVINYFRKYRARNRDKTRAWDRNFKDENAERLKKERHEKYLENKQKHAEAGKKRQHGYKKFIIETLGGKCVCCSENEIVFLTLEHINKDGGAHRRTKRNIYCEVIREGVPKNRYTVLCMNCNWAERNGKTCPHKKSASTSVVAEPTSTAS